MTCARGGSARSGARPPTRGSRSACTSHAATRPTSARSRPAGCASACNGTARWAWKPGRWRGEQSGCGSPRPPSSTPSCKAGTCPARGWPASQRRCGALMLDYLGHLRGMRNQRPSNRHGQPLSDSRVAVLMTGIEQFYAFMHDHRDTAAAALAEPGWLRLGPHHAIFLRRGEKPRKRRRGSERDVIDNDAFTQIMAGAGLLGVPAAEGGLGDEQAMRILMLLARTGRRVSEICLLDRAPLLPLGPAARARDSAGFTARLRYQQTKIEGAPDTILADEEIVAIIRAQQQWADRFLAASQSAATTPKYLFLAARNNRNGDRPYSPSRLRALLAQLAARLDVRDSTGAVVDFQRTHRFRHTKATSLLNAGVPLLVVAALPRPPVAGNDHDLRENPGVHPRGRVPALPQAHRRRPRARH